MILPKYQPRRKQENPKIEEGLLISQKHNVQLYEEFSSEHIYIYNKNKQQIIKLYR